MTDGEVLSLELELDTLYRKPATEFVAARNQLAQSLRRAGQRGDADRVAKLARPSPVAWMVNQLHFEAADVLSRLLAAGAELRAAQESGATSDAFTAKKRAHQDALRDATTRAVALGEAGAISATPALRRKVELTLNQLSAIEVEEPRPGRLTVELEPVGFDAFSTVAPITPSKPARPSPDDVERVRRVAAVKEALDAADKELRRLEQEAKVSQATHDRIVRDADEAERRAVAARHARDDARRALEEADARVADARRELESARNALEALKL